jgi:proteasome accessory factor B
MRDRMQLPLEYDRQRYGYYYTEKVSSFPTLQITEGELFALLVAEKALQQYRGTNFEKPLVSAFRKMADSLPDTVSLHLADWSRPSPFTPAPSRSSTSRTLTRWPRLWRSGDKSNSIIASRASARSRCAGSIPITWPTSTANGFSSPTIIYAATFAPSCRRASKPSGPPDKDSPARRNSPSSERCVTVSGCIQAGNSTPWSSALNESAADYIREKRWHPSQELRELKDGGVELRLKLSSLGEVQRWILSWGGHAVVVQPTALVTSVRQAARAILDRT